MEFTNEFSIPTEIDEAFEVLTDLERVAPCMPGATLEEVEGQTYSGQLKVKVGPITMTYAGTAELIEKDPEARTARIDASGRERRGAGTASADVRASLQDKDGETLVTVTTDINLTGKAGQFGRGVMAELGANVIDRFAENMREMLATKETSGAATTETPPAGQPATKSPEPAEIGAAASTGPRKVAHQAPRDEALDLLAVAGRATAKRLVPALAALGVILLVIFRWVL